MKFLRKNMRVIFLLTFLGFIAGIFIGFGGYFFGGSASGDTVAEINNTKIPYRKYISMFNRTMDRLRQENTEITDQVLAQKKQEIVQDLIQEEVFYQESKKYGITVSDQEIAYDIQRWDAFKNNGVFNQQQYFQVLAYRLKMTPQEFEESRKKQIAMAKLRELIISGIKLTDQEIQIEYYLKNKGNMNKFNTEKPKFFEELYREKVNNILQEWYKILNVSTKIKVYPELIK